MKKAKPEWLRVRFKSGQDLYAVKEMLDRLSLHTVCEEANCPNIMECFGRKTATFMILGKVCTRNCTFCNVTKGTAEKVDLQEPLHVAQAVRELKLKHVVVTSVTRDDLPDGGAAHFAEVIGEIFGLGGNTTIEVLIPDFQGDKEALRTVVGAKPNVINHNVETVPRLYPSVRPKAVYQRSLELLKRVKEMDCEIATKSGIMVGLGEKKEEIMEVLQDLRSVDCDLLTIGQYLSPSKEHHPVVEFIHPDEFAVYKEKALALGFKHVAAAPLVRSSYHADEAAQSVKSESNC